MIGRARLVLLTGTSLVLLAALAGVGLMAGLRVNLTPSYPRGLWRIEPLERDVSAGDRIFICPPSNAVFAAARERGYLGRGLCPGWFSPLIKTVVAIAGQHVGIDRDVTVDGVRVPRSTVRTADVSGRGLAAFGSGIVPDGQVFLFSEFAGSYDSRYFGPIPAAGVLGLAHPLLVLDP